MRQARSTNGRREEAGEWEPDSAVGKHRRVRNMYHGPRSPTALCRTLVQHGQEECCVHDALRTSRPSGMTSRIQSRGPFDLLLRTGVLLSAKYRYCIELYRPATWQPAAVDGCQKYWVRVLVLAEPRNDDEARSPRRSPPLFNVCSRMVLYLLGFMAYCLAARPSLCDGRAAYARSPIYPWNHRSLHACALHSTTGLADAPAAAAAAAAFSTRLPCLEQRYGTAYGPGRFPATPFGAAVQNMGSKRHGKPPRGLIVHAAAAVLRSLAGTMMTLSAELPRRRWPW